MPKKAERHAAVLNKLKSVIQHTDSKVVAERRLAIERWVKTYIRQVEYLKDDKLQFLYNIFRDESCWSGTRLNNTILGQRLTEEKTGGIENPLSRYNMACRYCVIDKIPLLFQRQFESYKSSFSSEEVDDDGKPATSNNKYVKSELLDAMKSEDPVFTFWIDKKSGCFKKHDDAVEGFNKAVEFKWSEGVEYFYNLLSEKEREKEITDAVTILSSVQCNHNGAVILDFCLSKMSNQAKNKLFKDSKLSKQDKGVYSLLNALIDQSFFDTVQAIIPMFRDKVLVDKILSHQDYALLFSSLSDTILENPELGIQAKAIMMDLWRCEHFNEHKKAAVDFSNSANLITDVLADLVIDWKNDNNKDRAIVKKGEILEILQFAKKVCSPEGLRDFKEDVIDDLRIIGRNSMKKNVNYSKLAEKLFAELDKVSLPSEKSDIGGAGDPQSTLRALGISGFSCHSK